MGKGSLGGHLIEWTIREQFDYLALECGLHSIGTSLSTSLITYPPLTLCMRGNNTRLPKNCLSRIWFKLAVNNEWLFFGLL